MARYTNYVFTGTAFLVLAMVQWLFGIAGAFDIQLHDTYLVISLIHIYLAFSLLFFLFALVYWCFDQVRGISIQSKYIRWHYWCTLAIPLTIVVLCIDQLVLAGLPRLFVSSRFGSIGDLLFLVSCLLFLIGQLIFLWGLLLSPFTRKSS